MADNLTTQTSTLASIPTSTVIATDDAGAGGHVQLVKLAIATDGSATPLTADNTDGLLVNLGTNNDVTVTGTVTVDGSGVTQPVSGTVTANLSATDNAVLDQLELNTSYGDNTGNGTATGALRVTIASDTTGVLSIDDNGGAITVDNGGTFAVQSASAGDVAHDSADSGNPVKVGYKAYNMDGTAPGTAVAEADRANGISDVYGRQYVETAHPNLWTATGAYTAAQTDTSVKAAPGASLSLYVTDIVVSTDTAFNCFFEHGTTKIIGPLYLAANGGAVMSFTTPIKIPANTALTFTSSATANHSITVNGYTAA